MLLIVQPSENSGGALVKEYITPRICWACRLLAIFFVVYVAHGPLSLLISTLKSTTNL
jgi:hypothetical protein